MRLGDEAGARQTDITFTLKGMKGPCFNYADESNEHKLLRLSLGQGQERPRWWRSVFRLTNSIARIRFLSSKDTSVGLSTLHLT